MGDALHFTIRYFDDWVMAQVQEVPGAISQGRTRSEARENVIDAMRLLLRPEPDQIAYPDCTSLSLRTGPRPRLG